MSSKSKTPLGLSQWEGTDTPERLDFNSDNLLVDSALQNKANIIEIYRPNIIINGDFSIWQRGNRIEITSAIVYTADMWITGNANQAIKTIEKSTDAPPGFSSSMKVTTLKSEFTYSPHIYQWIEKAQWGQVVTASVWVKGPSGATLSLAIWGGNQNSVILNGEWQFFSVTGIISNINNYNRIGILWKTTGCPIGDYYIAGAKLEQGNLYTGFYPEDPATGLARCQRYQESMQGFRIYQGNRSPWALAIDAPIIPYKVRKRARPLVTFEYELSDEAGVWHSGVASHPDTDFWTDFAINFSCEFVSFRNIFIDANV